MKITAEFIPHEKFHEGIWLLPIENPHWYYFSKKENKNNISDKKFISSVDESLKELVMFLHARNIKTTPSCSGHKKNKKDFEIIYNTLLLEKDKIRNGGLALKDIETGKEYLFRNKNYELPWSKIYFMNEIRSYQHKGIIGIRLDKKYEMIDQILHIKIPHVEITGINSLIFIHTNEETEIEIKKKWERITVEIKRIFSS